jgi:predicted dehydrogenase
MSGAWFDAALRRGDCRIAGLVDAVVVSALEKKEKYGLQAGVYTSLSEALAREDADIVFNITPPGAHCAVVTQALKAGCHVFGEKPMADTLEDAEAIVACAEATGKEHFVMQNYRYNPQICAIKDFIASGAPGKIGHISARFFKAVHFGGFRDEMKSPLINDMAIHTFDAARFISCEDSFAVYCHEYNPSWSWYKGDANAACVFEMGGGVIFDYSGSWCAGGFNTPWNSEWRVTCERGGIVWNGEDAPQYQPEAGGGICDIPATLMAEQGHAACINEMFDALNAGARPQTDCRDNIKSVRMVFKALESSRNKCRVEY